jgi:hypothetical protein
MIVCQSRSTETLLKHKGSLAPMPLCERDIQEQLSKAYVRAIVARCGYRCMPPDPDRGGDDLLIDSCGKPLGGGNGGGILRLQLKATARPVCDGDFQFPVPRTLYDVLRNTNRIGTFLLVVYVMPPIREHWLTSADDSLVVRHCAYWVQLRGLPPTTNIRTRSVTVPRRNVLNVASLSEIMRLISWEEEVGYEL